MEQLISAREAAERIGVSTSTVKAWIRRADFPLPAIEVGQSGTHFRVVANSIPSWLEAEASRKAQGVRRGKE
jgi:excisionase family DNA binding protein